MGRKRRTFSPKEKSKIALAALKERQTGAEIASEFKVHPNQISTWKRMAQQGIESVFEKTNKQDKKILDQSKLIEKLYGTIGQLQVELNWVKKKSEISK